MKCGNSCDIIHKDVVVIGNGPSGIALSYMLSGNIPYVVSTTHPDELLAARLEPVMNCSLVHEDLGHLAAGLEGRTTNPVSLLLDSLIHPYADIGFELDPLIEWRNDGSKFEKFGHNCEIRSGVQDFYTVKSGDLTICTRIRRYFQSVYLINETNGRGYNFLRSQKKIENERRKQLLYVFVIHPFSDFRKIWEIVLCVVFLLQFYMVPLKFACFDLDIEGSIIYSTEFTFLRILTDFISFIDIALSFFTGYCDKKCVQLKPIKIAGHYLRTAFTVDLLASIPFDVMEHMVYDDEIDLNHKRDCRFVSLIIISILKLSRIYVFFKYSTNLFDAFDNAFTFLRLWIGFIGFITYVHVICCFSIGWVNYETPYNKYTLKTKVFFNLYGSNIDQFSKLYVRYYYNTCIFILNSGYGFNSIAANSLVFTSVIWVFSRVLYIIAIAHFMELHTALQSSSQKYIDMVREVRDYMLHRQIPDFLQKRVLAYYDIKFQNCYFQESEILNTVSGQLRQEIIMNTCRKLVESVTFFKNLPLTLLVRIVSCLKYEIFLTNDVICKAGALGDCMFFISSGTVAVYTKSGKEICHLQDGDHFGEIALVMKEALRVASVISTEVCELYRLDRRDFTRAILPYPDLFEKILYVAGERRERTDVLDEANIFSNKIDHVVLGKGPPGGSWHSMDPQILTLSLGTWMALPGLRYDSRNGSEKRASAKSVAQYYERYVEEMDLEENFQNYTVVTSIRPLIEDNKSKWVEKVNNDICSKVKLCSRPEPKENSLNRSKSCTLSNAFNYILSRGQKDRKRSRDPASDSDWKIPELQNDNKHLYGSRILNNKRDKDRSISFSCDSDFTCDSFYSSKYEQNKPRVPTNKFNICDSKQQCRWIVEALDLKTRATITYVCDNLVLANGSSDLPNRLCIPNLRTDPYWLSHDLKSLEIELDLYMESNCEPDPVLIVGAGLSAADAIIAARARNVPVLHIYRNKSANLSKQLPENMYPEYHKVHEMMKDGSNYPLYTALPEYSLTDLDEESHRVILTSKEGKQIEQTVSFAAVLIGSKPDLSFLPNNYNLATKKHLPLDCKKNTVNINKLTHGVNGCDGLYAVGPLAGDNFVRFLPGGALAILCDLYQKYGY